jgi:hypothetical protein
MSSSDKSASLRFAATLSRSDPAAIPANRSPDFSCICFGKELSEVTKEELFGHIGSGLERFSDSAALVVRSNHPKIVSLGSYQ